MCGRRLTIFDKYGDRYIEFKKLPEGLGCDSPTLNELKEALYADFRERYDREFAENLIKSFIKRGIPINQEDLPPEYAKIINDNFDKLI